MRISDWSSDVCSSDLRRLAVTEGALQIFDAGARVAPARHALGNEMEIPVGLARDERPARQHAEQQHRRDDQRFLPQRAHRGGPVVEKEAAKPAEARLAHAIDEEIAAKTEERRVGKEWGSTCGSRGEPGP